MYDSQWYPLPEKGLMRKPCFHSLYLGSIVITSALNCPFELQNYIPLNYSNLSL